MGRKPLVCFCHLRWNFVHQRPQHIMTRLAQWRPVLYVEEPLATDGDCSLDLEEIAPNLHVARASLPDQKSGFDPDTCERHAALLRSALSERGWTEFVAWLYTPMAVRLARDLAPRAIVYDCMDELSAFRGAPQQMRRNEDELFECADAVFTGGPSLYAAKRDRHRDLHCFPSSVDVAHFALAPYVREPDDQAPIPRPRLGFFGVIDERMDFDVLSALADTHPEWQIVMIGPVVKIDPATLPRRPNLHYLGQRRYEDLPSYLSGWDVCLIPFAMNEATRFISPTKSLEYMAADRPIVSAPIRDVVDHYRDIVLIGAGPDGFVCACERALAMKPEDRTLRRERARKVLRATSWDETAKRMDEILHRVADVARPGRAAREAEMEGVST